MLSRKYILKSSFYTSRLARLMAKAIDLFMLLLLGTVFYPLGIVLGVIYIAVSDSLYDGQSIGKRLVGFKVISLTDGGPCTIKQSIIRNLPIIVPTLFALIPLWGWILSGLFALGFLVFEVYLLFKLDSGHRLGDVMADTSVMGSDVDKIPHNSRRSNSWFTQDEVMPTN